MKEKSWLFQFKKLCCCLSPLVRFACQLLGLSEQTIKVSRQSWLSGLSPEVEPISRLRCGWKSAAQCLAKSASCRCDKLCVNKRECAAAKRRPTSETEARFTQRRAVSLSALIVGENIVTERIMTKKQ